MKVLCVVLLAFLTYITSVNGERCKATQAKTSTLRCDDKVYSRPAAHIDAFNQCTKPEGTHISARELGCFHQKMGAQSATGAVYPEKLTAMLKETFTEPEHLQAILAGLPQCQGGHASSDPYAVTECYAKLYEKVCGHKSCDWFNSD